jgi:hypothetical protein
MGGAYSDVQFIPIGSIDAKVETKCDGHQTILVKKVTDYFHIINPVHVRSPFLLWVTILFIY